MKKIILLSAIVITTLVSCSTEDAPVYNQNSSKTSSIKETPTDFCITCRDSTSRAVDSTNISEPIKPRRD